MKSDLIFDFDGTIADSFKVAEAIFYELTGMEKVTDQKLISHLRSLPLLKAAKEMHITPPQITRLWIRGRALMKKYIGEVESFRGMNPVLYKLHEDGHRLFIISSNSPQNVNKFMKNNDLEDCFDGIYGGIGLFSKARAIRKVMRKNRIKRENCFYIGDEVRDLNAAKHARVRAIGVSWGYNDTGALLDEKPYAVINKPQELLQIFKSS